MNLFSKGLKAGFAALSAGFAAFRKKPVLVSPPTFEWRKDLIILQGRRARVIPQAVPDLVITPALNPYQAIPEKHKIVRIGRKKEWVLLENDGILQVAIKFNIADRKKLGINNKTRQLTLDYKVVATNLKNVLNDYIQNGNSTPIGPPYFASVKGVQQTFIGTFNNVKLVVPVTVQDLQENLNLGFDGITNTDNYLKVITYKFYQAWRTAIAQPGFVEPSPRLNLGTAPVGQSAVLINNQNLALSSGLFIFKDDQPLFETTIPSAPSSITRDIAAERDLEGRISPPSESPTVEAGPETNIPTSNNFNFLSRLPLAFTIIERNNFNISPTENNSFVNSLRQTIRNIGENVGGSSGKRKYSFIWYYF